VLQAPTPALACDLVFSALDPEVASVVEPTFVEAGVPIFSNARSFRMEPGVPLLVPEVNPDHIEILREGSAGGGFIVANPNCATTGLVLALKPLADAFGLRRVAVTTMQAISGAGYPGVPALDILGNVIPLIPGEEEKLETEPLKILGTRVKSEVLPAPIVISAQANRVPVLDGHLLSVSVELGDSVDPMAATEVLEGFRSPVYSLGLPSAPERPVLLSKEPGFPQPRLHAGLGGGMVVGVGRLRRCPLLGLRFLALVHNTIRGAAGGAILNAEFLGARGMLG
jgi:aspartate-semialdehyde dehydrogenase